MDAQLLDILDGELDEEQTLLREQLRRRGGKHSNAAVEGSAKR